MDSNNILYILIFQNLLKTFQSQYFKLQTKLQLKNQDCSIAFDYRSWKVYLHFQTISMSWAQFFKTWLVLIPRVNFLIYTVCPCFLPSIKLSCFGFKIKFSLNFFKPVYFFQTSLVFSNQLIFFKLVWCFSNQIFFLSVWGQ